MIGLGHQFDFMTSCGNPLLKDLKIVSYSQTPSVILKDFLMYSYSLFKIFFCSSQSLTQVTTKFIFPMLVLATCHSPIFHLVVVVLPSASG